LDCNITGLPKKNSKASAEFLISAAVALTILSAFVCFWGWFLYHRFGRKYKVDEEIGNDGMLLLYTIVFSLLMTDEILLNSL
jgi:hypothetical protein